MIPSHPRCSPLPLEIWEQARLHPSLLPASTVPTFSTPTKPCSDSPFDLLKRCADDRAEAVSYQFRGGIQVFLYKDRAQQIGHKASCCINETKRIWAQNPGRGKRAFSETCEKPWESSSSAIQRGQWSACGQQTPGLRWHLLLQSLLPRWISRTYTQHDLSSWSPDFVFFFLQACVFNKTSWTILRC